MDVYPIAVIGGGAAGTMAALRGVLNNDDVLMFPGSPKDKKRSRGFWVAKVENIPGLHHYKKGIVGPHQETMQWIAESPHAERLHVQKNRGVVSIKKDGDVFILKDNKDQEWKAQYVILCTGLMDVQPEIAGSIDPILPFANVQVADYCLRCDGHHVLGKKTSVIGHDIGAAWVAIMLYERYKTPEMKILTHGQEPEFDETTEKLIKLYGIQVIKGEIKEVRGDHKEPRLDGFEIDGEGFVESEFSFVSLGMIIYNELAKQLGADLDERGFVKTDAKGKSSIDGLYVAGDLRADAKLQIYTA